MIAANLLSGTNNLLFAINNSLFVTNNLLFKANNPLFVPNNLLFRTNNPLFVTNNLLFALNNLVFITNNLLFVLHNLVFVTGNLLLMYCNSLIFLQKRCKTLRNGLSGGGKDRAGCGKEKNAHLSGNGVQKHCSARAKLRRITRGDFSLLLPSSRYRQGPGSP